MCGCIHVLLYSHTKEASEKSPKSEKIVFQLDLAFYFQSEFESETLILLKDM